MKINMSFPATGCQKLLEITDELKVMTDIFYCAACWKRINTFTFVNIYNVYGYSMFCVTGEALL